MVIHLIDDVGQNVVIGSDPFRTELLWRTLYSRGYAQHPDLATMGVVSGFEMACWDIVGKAVNQPIYNLLGGQYHERLRAYTYLPAEGVWENPEKAGDVARRLLAEGFTDCKIDPFMPLFPLPRDIPLKDLKHPASIFGHIRDGL